MKIKIYPGVEAEFVDVSSEIVRTYIFPNKEQVVIKSPKWLYVSSNGHRVIDADGYSHYIPKGWIHLYWKVKSGEPFFVR